MLRILFNSLLLVAIVTTVCSADFHTSPSKPVLPFYFEKNVSQSNAAATYFSRNGEFSVAISGKGSMTLSKHVYRNGEASAITLAFKGLSGSVEVGGEDRQEGVSNYFRGNDEGRWVRGVPHFSKIRARNIYPGIDAVFYAEKGKNLEFDLIAQPDSNPREVRLGFEGARSISLDSAGRLLIETPAGSLIENKPTAYQICGQQKRAVDAHYVINSGSEVGLALGAYDRRKTLIVDPVISYSTYLGGSGSDGAAGIALDPSGSIYVVGTTDSINFPTHPGSYDNHINGETDVFVSKFSPSGTLLYSTYLGGSLRDSGRAIAVDTSGNAYVTGTAISDDFPGFQIGPTSSGAPQVFVSKLDPSGSSLLYSVKFGGSAFSDFNLGGSFPFGIAVDTAGEAYVAGNTCAPDFPTTEGSYQPVFGGGADAVQGCGDIFVTKISPSGRRFVYSTYIGGTGVETAYGIALDSSGNAYIAGKNVDGQYPTTQGAFQVTYPANSVTVAYNAAVVSKLDSTGSNLLYSTYLGGTDQAGAFGVTVLDGYAYVTGTNTSPDFPTTRKAYKPSLTNPYSPEVFVTKFNQDGSKLAYSTFLGGDGFDGVPSIAVDSVGNSFVTGSTNSATFPVTSDAFEPAFQNMNGNMPFVTKLNSAGSGLLWSSFLGGSNGSDVSTSIATDQDGNAFVVGQTSSTDYPTTRGAFQTTYRGNNSKSLTSSGGDAFMTRISPLCSLSSINLSVTICSPSNNALVGSPMDIQAGTTDDSPVTDLKVFLDGRNVYEAHLAAIEVKLAVPVGMHQISIQATDNTGRTFSKEITVEVR